MGEVVVRKMGEVVVRSEGVMELQVQGTGMKMEVAQSTENKKSIMAERGGSAAVEAAAEAADTSSSAPVVKWERFLPKMAMTVLLVVADDSTRQIIVALLRKCSYKGILVLRFAIEYPCGRLDSTGCQLSMKIYKGRHAGTPLHHAAKRGLEQTVKLLLSHGANALVMNYDCQIPLDVARTKGFSNVVRAIEEHICLFSGWL